MTVDMVTLPEPQSGPWPSNKAVTGGGEFFHEDRRRLREMD
jgi:hypothetical protein